MTVSHVETYTLTFFEGFEAIAFDRGEVSEHVRAVVLLNKTKPLESLNHFTVPSTIFFSISHFGIFRLCHSVPVEIKKHASQPGLRVSCWIDTLSITYATKPSTNLLSKQDNTTESFLNATPYELIF